MRGEDVVTCIALLQPLLLFQQSKLVLWFPLLRKPCALVCSFIDPSIQLTFYQGKELVLVWALEIQITSLFSKNLPSTGEFCRELIEMEYYVLEEGSRRREKLPERVREASPSRPRAAYTRSVAWISPPESDCELAQEGVGCPEERRAGKDGAVEIGDTLVCFRIYK